MRDDEDDQGRADYEAYQAEEIAAEMEEMLDADDADEEDLDLSRAVECVMALAGFPYKDLIKRARNTIDAHQAARHYNADLDRSERFMRAPMNEPESMDD